MNTPDKAVEAAARDHYAYVWANVNGDPLVALGNWDAGRVDPDTMTYHRHHVRPQVEAAYPAIAAQVLREFAEGLEPDDRRESARLDEFREGLDYAQERAQGRAADLEAGG